MSLRRSSPVPLCCDLALIGVLGLVSLPAPPAHAQSPATWTSLPPHRGPAATTGGWTVFDSRRGRFLHHAGSYYYFLPHFGPGYGYPAGTFAMHADAWTPWSLAADDGPLPAREMAAAVYDSAADRVLLVGGVVKSASAPWRTLGDAWQLDLAGGSSWQRIEAAGPAPRPRYDASMVLDAARHRLLLYGGLDSLDQPLDDVWSLALDGTPAWSALAPGAGPEPRHAHAAAYDSRRDQMVVACGLGGGDAAYTDAWALALTGSPSWISLSPAGPAPDGATVGAIDAANDRLLTFSAGVPVRVRALDLRPGGAWDSVRTLRTPPSWDWAPLPAPVSFQERISTAFDPVRRAAPLLWNRYAGFNLEYQDSPLLRFTTLAPIGLEVTPPIVTFSRGTTELDWRLLADHPLYERAVVNTFQGPVPLLAEARVAGFPDSLGTFAFLQRGLTPGARYGYRVVWFDGVADRDTGDFFMDTPPHPADIGFAFDSVAYRGRDFNVHFGAADDSARLLSTQSFERRIPPEPWQAAWSPAFFSAANIWPETNVIPDTMYEYRAAWGDPAALVYSTPFPVRSRPEPVFHSITAIPGAVDLVWTIRPGYAFTGRLYRFPNGLPDLAAPVTDVVGTLDGTIRARDTTIPPQQTVIYYLVWEVGGVELRDTGYAVDTKPDGGTPGPQGDATLADLENPSFGAIDCAVVVAADEPAEVAVYDPTGRVCLRQIYQGPGRFRLLLEGSRWRSGIYLVRLTHAGRSRVTRVALIR